MRAVFETGADLGLFGVYFSLVKVILIFLGVYLPTYSPTCTYFTGVILKMDFVRPTRPGQPVAHELHAALSMSRCGSPVPCANTNNYSQ